MKIANYLDKFNLPKKKVTEEQFLAGEIYEYFGKKLSFGWIMVIVKTKGKIYVRETFEKIRKGNAKDRLALFLWTCAECKINYNPPKA